MKNSNQDRIIACKGMKYGQHHRHDYALLFFSQILAREEQTKSKVPCLSMERFFGHDNIQFYVRNSAGSAQRVFWKYHLFLFSGMAQGVQIEFCRCMKRNRIGFLSISVDGIIAAGYIVFTSSYTCTEVSRNRGSKGNCSIKGEC